MTGLLTLADELDALAFTLPAQATNAKSKKCAEIILTDVLRETPVDEGTAISNWQISIGTPSDDIIEAYVKGSKGSTQLENQNAAFETAMNVLETKSPGQPIYIFNALPYIRILNDGTSSRPPIGFVERAVLLGRLYAQDPAAFGD